MWLQVKDGCNRDRNSDHDQSADSRRRGIRPTGKHQCKESERSEQNKDDQEYRMIYQRISTLRKITGSKNGITAIHRRLHDSAKARRVPDGSARPVCRHYVTKMREMTQHLHPTNAKLRETAASVPFIEHLADDRQKMFRRQELVQGSVGSQFVRRLSASNLSFISGHGQVLVWFLESAPPHAPLP
jgi:hypothetical protein